MGAKAFVIETPNPIEVSPLVVYLQARFETVEKFPSFKDVYSFEDCRLLVIRCSTPEKTDKAIQWVTKERNDTLQYVRNVVFISLEDKVPEWSKGLASEGIHTLPNKFTLSEFNKTIKINYYRKNINF